MEGIRVTVNRTDLLSMYAFLLDQVEEGIHVVDTAGKTVIYNRKMAEMEFMEPQDVLGRSVLDVFTFPEEGYSTLLRALRTGEPKPNVKQTFFNLRGEVITTINSTMPILKDGKIIGALEIAREITKLEQMQKTILRRSETRYTFASLIGESAAIIEVTEDAKRAARTHSSILIVGETGTGKELFAQSIHHASPRSAGPFVSQNCAALPETLIEGILFGTTQGAFSGALDRAGLLEQADGGTILLDELNVLGLSLQAKLLRAIQEKTIRRLGDSVDREIDVRILATISEDPLDAITGGHLRKDLYYRLSVVTLFLPPLRERSGDIPQLTSYFIHKYNELFRMSVLGVSAEVMSFFMSYPWPGNVRELEHTIEGALNLVTDAREIEMSHLPLHMRRRRSGAEGERERAGETALYVEADDKARDLHRQLADYERVYVQRVLAIHAGNISAAARELGVSRQSLQYRLRKWADQRADKE
ncbi:sigma-54 interaction domain-containing protein [Ferroacidibacillus organovorans]|uniref:Sigma-54-dependent Fis family transcriptional regulator n=1 Tax=Ferroacidibacillus organovorans TaxID=1765683 RepID=A0A1V4EWB2_9BACL|nr:sigma 54-interacting transcriptional regulator [Ferroacidibacillus organovorans]OPG17225.1 sigma-54-dependent Fis family transcriptional regulator [Ferroacidibacillus organovorans]